MSNVQHDLIAEICNRCRIPAAQLLLLQAPVQSTHHSCLTRMSVCLHPVVGAFTGLRTHETWFIFTSSDSADLVHLCILEDAFIQSDLLCIQAIKFLSGN